MLNTRKKHIFSKKVSIRLYSPGLSNPSETKHNVWFCPKKQDKRGTFSWFISWFVGYTDGNGTFSVYTNKTNKKIKFSYKLSLKSNNAQVLYFIKKSLKVGQVVHEKTGMSSYIIKNKKSLEENLIPLIDSYPLKTKKYYDYLVFKKALEISNNKQKNQKVKIEEIELIKNSNIFKDNYRPLEVESINKAWIVGFIEAEGSFYITKNDKNRLSHGWGITLKEDGHILEKIKKELNINAKVKYNKKGFFSLDTTDQKSLKHIKDYFFKMMYSRKSLIYRIWGRSFRHRNKLEKLKEIQEFIRKLK